MSEKLKSDLLTKQDFIDFCNCVLHYPLNHDLDSEGNYINHQTALCYSIFCEAYRCGLERAIQIQI